MNPRTAVRSLASFVFGVAFGAVLSAGMTQRANASPATLESGAVLPPNPVVCDSVELVLAGRLPNSCYSVVGFRVSRPEEIPVLGPIPAYRIRAIVRSEAPDPALQQVCTTADQPYRVSNELGRLPFGNYHVMATEYLYPYPASSSAPIDSNSISFFFSVGAGSDSCVAATGCAMLGFASTGFDGPRVDGCTARSTAGERVCFDVTLKNEIPVAGVQTDIVYSERAFPWVDQSPVPIWFKPVAVTTTARSAGFTVDWVADGMTAKVVLYSPTGASLGPGRGPILHVCYDVHAELPEGAYPVQFQHAVLSSPEGGNIPFCPTFSEVLGRVCVGTSHCDLNSDGIGDVRDIVRLARCVFAHGTDVCPDSVYQAADCNGDSTVDIRDVVCCVRDILAHDGGWGGPPPGPAPPNVDGSTIRFELPPVWLNNGNGWARLGIFAGATFGGMQFFLASDAARITDIAPVDLTGRYEVLWQPAPGGARVMILDRGPVVVMPSSGAGPATRAGAVGSTFQLDVTFAPETGAAGTMTLRSVQGATADGGALGVQGNDATETIPANALMAAAPVVRAHPNPFVSETRVSYSLKTAGRASLRIYDVNGRLVRTLFDGAADAGVHLARWDGRDDRGRTAGVGIYFIRLAAGSALRTERILRLR